MQYLLLTNHIGCRRELTLFSNEICSVLKSSIGFSRELDLEAMGRTDHREWEWYKHKLDSGDIGVIAASLHAPLLCKMEIVLLPWHGPWQDVNWGLWFFFPLMIRKKDSLSSFCLVYKRDGLYTMQYV